MAGGETIGDGAELGFLHTTALDGHGAAQVERAARRRHVVRCTAEIKCLVVGGFTRPLQGARVWVSA